MALRHQEESPKKAEPGDMLLVIHDFEARSPDELSLTKGDRIELVERDDDFGDGWYLGKHMQHGGTGLFPEVYTTTAPRSGLLNAFHTGANGASTTRSSPSGSQYTTGRLSTGDQNATSVAVSTVTIAANNTQPPQSPSMASTSFHTSPPPLYMSNSPQRVASLPNAAFASQPMASNLSSQRSISMMLEGNRNHSQESPVMNETLTVIDEHITNMGTPRSSMLIGDNRLVNDSGSDYSSHITHRLSYIHGSETDEEERIAFSEEEVLRWTPEQAAKYLEQIGVERRHCDVFREQEISGEVLLSIDQAAIFMKELDLGVVGRRLRTWHKIRAFQEEVRSNVALSSRNGDFFGDTGSFDDPDPSTGRSSTSGSKLPRIPGLMDHNSSLSTPRHGSQGSPLKRPSSHGEHKAQFSQGEAVPKGLSPKVQSRTGPELVPGSTEKVHPRRSSVDVNRPVASLGSPNSKSAESSTSPRSLPPCSGSNEDSLHKRQPSYDASWKMPVISSSANNPTVLALGLSGLGMTGPALSLNAETHDLDRGYTSGGELENKKTRNVLRKKDPASVNHSRQSSYKEEQNVGGLAVSKRHSRFGSAGSIRDAIASVTSVSGSKGRARASSTKESASPAEMSKDADPPVVTKLEYTQSPTKGNKQTSSCGESPLSNKDFFNQMIRFRSGSPVHRPEEDQKSEPGCEGKKALATSPTTKNSNVVTPSTTRASDTVTGSERSTTITPSSMHSPAQGSPKRTPSESTSITTSGCSKSLEKDGTDTPPKSNTAVPFVLAPISAARRGKNKKKTSAYIRGLRKISPQEAMADCDYSGWMKKKSPGIMAIWKPRLFVLHGRRLAYYYSEKDTEEKGLIDISSHRVLRADNEFLTGIHAAVTGAKTSPTSPANAQTPTMNSIDAAAQVDSSLQKSRADSMFIFKLVPPRAGLSRAVQFTKPTIHYFAVDNLKQGRLWMGALMKATIDRDDSKPITSTYQQRTISLAKAKAMRQRPPALMGLDEQAEGKQASQDGEGLKIEGLNLSYEDIADAVHKGTSTNGAAESADARTASASKAEQAQSAETEAKVSESKTGDGIPSGQGG